MQADATALLDRVMDALTAAGGPLETVPFARFGTTIPALRAAPPSLCHLFAQACARHGAATFLVEGELRLGFAEVERLARRAATGLVLRHGVAPGMRVGIAGRNSAGWIVLYFAVLLAGGCATLLNAREREAGLARAVDLADCELVLADAGSARRLAGLANRARVVAFADGDPETGLAEVLAPEPAALPFPEPDDPATIVFTTGSGGPAKAAWSDHRAVVHAALSALGQALLFAGMAEATGTSIPADPATLLTLPLFHVTGEMSLLWLSLLIGRKLVIMPRWDAGEALRLIERERITYFLGVPSMSHELATHPDRAGHDLSACLHFAAGGAPRPPAHVDALRRSFPASWPIIGYGLTETNAAGCGTWNEAGLMRPASTGLPNRPLVELAILDADGARMAAGETGEIAIRSICNARGYWGDPEATAQAFRADGFFRTGDLGSCDADGYLTIVDRAKDIILRNGENIACIEIEAALFAHPAVAEACAFAVPDPRHGEVPAAVWRARPGAALTSATLAEFAAGRLAPHKLPVHLREAAAPLPRHASGKIDRKALKAHFAWDEEPDKARS